MRDIAENNPSYEIEFAYGSGVAELRFIYWRIKPRQLNWFQRHFSNPWRQIYRCCVDELLPYFSAEKFKSEIKPCRTVADIQEYMGEQYRLVEEVREWPSDPNE